MNLHYETVSPLLKETLQKLVNSPIFELKKYSPVRSY
jgi:hypothetical protein